MLMCVHACACYMCVRMYVSVCVSIHKHATLITVAYRHICLCARARVREREREREMAWSHGDQHHQQKTCNDLRRHITQLYHLFLNNCMCNGIVAKGNIPKLVIFCLFVNTRVSQRACNHPRVISCTSHTTTWPSRLWWKNFDVRSQTPNIQWLIDQGRSKSRQQKKSD